MCDHDLLMHLRATSQTKAKQITIRSKNKIEYIHSKTTKRKLDVGMKRAEPKKRVKEERKYMLT